MYKCGFAKSQQAYDDAINNLYRALDRVEDVLSTSRYIASNTAFTEADLRLFMTLVSRLFYLFQPSYKDCVRCGLMKSTWFTSNAMCAA